MNLSGVLRVIGPGAILLGMGIGSGEWVLGPAAAVKFGPSILWIATVAIIVQILALLEATRYTMYTGEPLTTGLMRLWPGPRFWGSLLLLLLVLSLGWPVWAFGAATALVAAYLGRLSGPADVSLLLPVGLVLALLVIAVLSVGGKVVRLLELVQWVMVIFTFTALLALVALTTPPSILISTARGFLDFGKLPPIDIISAALLLGAVAGYAGLGAFGNTFISSYYRDKGFGMGALVGSIPTLIGGAKITLSPTGVAFKVNEDNLRKWGAWRKVALIDILGVFGVGAFLGMFLPAALALALIPVGSDIGGWAVAVYQGEELRKLYGIIGWAMVLVMGFWILYSTQFALTEAVARTATDILWYMSRVRQAAKGDVRRVYYVILIILVLWIMAAFILFHIFKVNPLIAVALVANMSNLVWPLTVLGNIYLNMKYLPKEIRPSPIIVAGLLVGVAFWLTFFALFIASLILR
ncbi:MAG: Nramp family divalent metal transporter [Thermoprotei archaeon]|nr:Nramp family divalent metal transporter [Thermoprotei archaeon]